VETAQQPTEVFEAQPRQALVLDRYRLVRRLGAGGFGVVWLAHDEHLDRAVALKCIGVLGQDPARAEREALAAARLSHAGIVALYEAGRDDDAVYLVSELVRGRTLAQLIADGELSDRDVLRIGVALCDALDHAHGRGVVHRDVKPGNVIVPDDPAAGVAKLTDFGIARVLGDDALTRTGDVVGTLAYMAPEQAEGHSSGAPGDLYSLAIVLYEALAGVNPIRGRGPAATARRVGARLPPLGRLRRDLPPELCAAIDRAVLPRPEERGALADLREALQDAMREVDDEPGAVLASRSEAVGRAGLAAMPSRPSDRLLAAAGAAALTASALAWLGPEPLVVPAAGAAGAAIACALLPRLGWIACAVTLVTWLAVAPAGGLAVVVALALAPVPLLLRRSRASWWSAAAVAPVMDVIGGGAAWLALAGQAARPWHRAALGALGWWAVLAGRVLDHGRGAWAGSAHDAWQEGIKPVVGDGTVLAVAGVWALAALTLPLLVRGRTFALDLAGAAIWGTALAAGTQALAPDVGAAVLGAVLAGVLAVLVRASRGPAAA
jgi:eukaryotic-like serine/threonine-protein kinase